MPVVASLNTMPVVETMQPMQTMVQEQPQVMAQPQIPHLPMLSSTSLYVGDLHVDVNEAMLFELFNSVGPVASLRVCRDSESRRSLGYAYVNFHNSSDAERALDTLNHYEIKGRTMRVMWSQRDPSFRKSNVGNIYIKNLEAGIDNKSLYDTFSVFGNILSCKVCPNGDSSYGFVHFETQEAADAAIQKVNGMLLNGMKVFVGPFQAKKERQSTSKPKEAPFTNVFVKNIPDKWAENDLTNYFSQFGTITSTVLMADASGVSKCFGFLNYAEPSMAVAAVDNANGLVIEEKPLYVSRAQKKNERQNELRQKYLAAKQERIAKYQGANLFIKNLAETVDDERLRNEFSRFGTITSSRVMFDEKNNHKGFGFVCFTNPEDATKAVAETNNMPLDGKPLYVALAQQKEERKEHLANQYAARANAAAMRIPQQGMPQYPGQPMFYQNMAPQPRNAMMYQNPQGRRFPRPATGYYVQAPPQMAAQRVQRGGRRQNMPPMRQNMQPQQPQQMAQRPVNMQTMELNASMLAEASEPEQREMIGNRLFQMIVPTHGELAGKITGMLLEMDISELLHLLESPESLSQKVNEAVAAIEAHQNEEMKA